MKLYDKDKQSKKMEELGFKQIEASADLKTKFFFHWSILSGATFTLVIPLLIEITNKKDNISGICYIKTTIILLTIALISASLRNYFASIRLLKSAFANFKQAEENNKAFLEIVKCRNILIYLQRGMEIIALVGYIFALIFLYIFISRNLF